MDKNQAIGLTIIFLLLIGYFSYFAPEKKQPAPAAQENQTTQKPDKATQESTPDKPDKEAADKAKDSTGLANKYGPFAAKAKGNEKTLTLENKDIKVFLSNKGGRVKKVRLKNYYTADDNPLYIFTPDNNKFSITAPLKEKDVNISELIYKTSRSRSEDTTIVRFKLDAGRGKHIEHVYKLPPKGFQLDYNIKFEGMQPLMKSSPLVIDWKTDLINVESDISDNRDRTYLNYYFTDDELTQLGGRTDDTEEENTQKPLKWVTYKQKFFSIGMIAHNQFNGGQFKSTVNPDDTSIVKTFSSKINIPEDDVHEGNAGFTFYYGPNKYPIVKKVTTGFKENVYLGWPVINIINRFVIVPVFTFLENFISNYGIIILILVLIIKLVLFPLSYKSYYSMAKMRLLKPELDELKSQYGDDMKGMQQEQMKLFQKVGVSPFAGCIPILLQMPILIAMFNFFPNSIELRRESFLWADDLSTYDSIMSLPFSIPFYGDHVSLFTLLMTGSTILYTYYNNQMNATATGPMITMSYLMPLVFMFVLNNLPAALSYYYFVSNVITIGQQLIIKNFIIDEDKIRAQLEENKRTAHTRKKNRFQQRIEKAMEEQEKQRKTRSNQAAKPANNQAKSESAKGSNRTQRRQENKNKK